MEEEREGGFAPSGAGRAPAAGGLTGRGGPDRGGSGGKAKKVFWIVSAVIVALFALALALSMGGGKKTPKPTEQPAVAPVAVPAPALTEQELKVKLANEGDLNAQRELGESYLVGKDGVSNPELAEKYLRMAAKGNDPRSNLLLADMLFKRGDWSEAQLFYAQAANLGAEGAYYGLANLLLQANYKDKAACAELLRLEQAKTGNKQASLRLATLLLDEPSLKSAKEGMDRLVELAKGGYPDAQKALADLYANGHRGGGLTLLKDPPAAKIWMSKYSQSLKSDADYDSPDAAEDGQPDYVVQAAPMP